MASESEFVEFLVETLGPLGQIRARKMFGGYGIYRGDLMFGLVADEIFYLKVDDHNRETFAAEGSKPFMYTKNGKEYAMSYYRIPDEALDDPESLRRWAEIGYEAAVRAAKNKSRRKTNRSK